MFKTNECLWCGGAKLQQRPKVGRHEKFECVDREACQKRIRDSVAFGRLLTPAPELCRCAEPEREVWPTYVKCRRCRQFISYS
jgi:hypothetical protein